MMTDKKEDEIIELLDMLKMIEIKNEQILQDKPVSSNRKEFIRFHILGATRIGKSALINYTIKSL